MIDRQGLREFFAPFSTSAVCRIGNSVAKHVDLRGSGKGTVCEYILRRFYEDQEPWSDIESDLMEAVVEEIFGHRGWTRLQEYFQKKSNA